MQIDNPYARLLYGDFGADLTTSRSEYYGFNLRFDKQLTPSTIYDLYRRRTLRELQIQ